MQYNHDTFKQWWEFLKLSEDYKSICKLASKHKEDTAVFPLIKKLINEFGEKEKIQPIERYMKLLAVYEKFGDVHQNDFEDWLKNYNKPKSVKTEMEKNEYKEEKYKRLNEALKTDDKQLQLYIEIWEQIIYFPYLYTRIQPYVNLNRLIKDIDSDMHNFIKKLKQDAEKNKREVNERNDYLRILRLFQEGNSIPQIIEKIGSKKEKDKNSLKYENVKRSYFDKKSKAELILKNVEGGTFP